MFLVGPIAAEIPPDVPIMTLDRAWLGDHAPRVQRAQPPRDVQHHAVPPGVQLLFIGLIGHQHAVFFLGLVAGMSELLRELAVIGEQDQAFAVQVQPAHRVEALLGGHQVAADGELQLVAEVDVVGEDVLDREALLVGAPPGVLERPRG